MDQREEYIRPEIIVNLAENTARDINEYLSRPLIDLQVILANPLFLDYFKNHYYGLMEEAEICLQKLEKYMLNFIRLNRNCFRLRLTDGKGDQIVKIEYDRADRAKENISDKDYFKESIRGQNGSVKICGLEKDKEKDVFLMVYSCPCYDETHTLKGLLFLKLDFGKVMDNVYALKSGKGDYSYIIDDKGCVLLHSDEKALIKKDLLSLTRQEKEKEHEAAILQILSGKVGWLEYQINSALFLAAFAPIIIMKWALVIVIPAPQKAKIEAFTRELENTARERTKELEIKVKELNESQKAMLFMIEDLNKTSRELKDAQEKLVRAEKLSAIGKLAGIMGHEIRNPLGVIRNAVYFINLQLGASVGEKINKHMNIINQEIDSADKIISNVLAFARIKTPVLSKESINPIILGTLSEMDVPKNIKVLTGLAADLPLIMLNASQMKQVFYNMITNAMEAMPQGGTLKITSSRTGKFAVVAFEDSGCGIAEENLDKIFGPLFSTKVKGVGLGLATCQTIIAGHKGKIQVESGGIGRGATFRILLPIG